MFKTVAYAVSICIISTLGTRQNFPGTLSHELAKEPLQAPVDCLGQAKKGLHYSIGKPVAIAEKTMVSVECGREFIFALREQEFFNTRGVSNEPKRCQSCRAV